MKHFTTLIIGVFILGIPALSATPDRMFYRLVAETNTTITGLTSNGTLTWTNAANTISYSIEATSDLGNLSTSYWGIIEYGLVTNLIMTTKVPNLESPFPPTNSSVFVPAGNFLMGDSYNSDAYLYDVPSHPVRTSAYFMDPTEVSRKKWEDVVGWATNNGYVFENAATATDTNFPISTVSWYDCVKWCNARSQKEGYSPVYFTDDSLATVYKEGTNDLASSCVHWSGNGYRLPTEAEWEKAARGGLVQNYYPWTSPGKTNESIYVDPTNANYEASGIMDSTIVASYPPNTFGLFDMAGNVSEWCWDWSDSYSPSYSSDPKGPASGTSRVARGGSYSSDFNGLRCSARDQAWTPSYTDPHLGFRCVRSCP